jgi:hypothetical protein
MSFTGQVPFSSENLNRRRPSLFELILCVWVCWCGRPDLNRRFCLCAPRYPHTFMGGDNSRLFRADENSQTGTSFPGGGTSYPESGTSLQRGVLHRVTYVTWAAICKEDSGGISYCEHSLSSCLSSLLVLCVWVGWCGRLNLNPQWKGSLLCASHETRTRNYPACING